MRPPVFETFGCRLNAYETEAMKKLAAEQGLSDAVVVNTCAVTAEAVRQARQRIRRLRREHPQARLIVTGCAAQTEPETFARMAEVDVVMGNGLKMKPGSWAPDFIGAAERVRVDDVMTVRETAGHLIDGFGTRSRAYVQIQNGCDHRCTFCVIPFGRGVSRSAPAGEVVEQIRRLVGAGYNEVVLTGVDLTSWGDDLPGRPPLGDLVQRVLRLVPDLARLRLSSIDSIEADAALIDAMASDARLMPHLHLSLQSGDDMILKRMKRRHLRDDAIRFCEDIRARRPDVVFGADLIAGFPTETDAMFENSLRLVADCGLTWLHVFPYSARKGTPAARMPQVAKAARAE
jgi:threonylcarbamoyladenosine tRNA methylthiotransferase MtaB